MKGRVRWVVMLFEGGVTPPIIAGNKRPSSHVRVVRITGM